MLESLVRLVHHSGRFVSVDDDPVVAGPEFRRLNGEPKRHDKIGMRMSEREYRISFLCHLSADVSNVTREDIFGAYIRIGCFDAKSTPPCLQDHGCYEGHMLHLARSSSCLLFLLGFLLTHSILLF